MEDLSQQIAVGAVAAAVKAGDESYEVGSVTLNNVELVSLLVDEEERVCLAQLSNTLLKDYSYNEIHNRRVALGITCVQCTPLQLEVLRRTGAMPMSSRRCGMITRREAERLFKSFFNDIAPPNLPSDFMFSVYHECGWGCAGFFIPSKYNSSRAKCIQCSQCSELLSPNKFIFHYHQTNTSSYIHPDAANFNSWRRHIQLTNQSRSKEIEYAWEDVKALFNGGSRKRLAKSPPRQPAEENPGKLVSGMFSEGQHSMGSSLCPILPPSVPSSLCSPSQQKFPGFSAGFPTPFLRAAAAGASVPDTSALQKMWSQSHHFALNELLHRTRLFVPSLTAPHPSYHQLQHRQVRQRSPYQTQHQHHFNRPESRLMLENHNLTDTQTTTIHSTATHKLAPGDSGIFCANNSNGEVKEKKIKRPWMDSSTTSLAENSNNTTAAAPTTSEGQVISTAPLAVGEEDHNQTEALRAFLHRIEHSGVLL